MRKILFLSLFLLSVLLQEAMAQSRTITGRVTDAANGDGLPGVTVLVKGTQVGTATDATGNYTINVPENGTTLIFSFVGYTTTERTIGNATTLNVALATDAKQLGEVVVTALGREQEKRTLGYATQEVGSEALTQGRERSVLNSLQGKVAGVNIQSQGGAPGSSTRVVIRGNKSFTGSNQALFVVDGIPIDNGAIGANDATGLPDNLNNGVDVGNRANDINPDDIESVNILKGPAAAALYGARAANGAIMITTKSGKNANKKAEITVVSSYTVEDVLRYPTFQNSYGQGFFGAPDLLENTSWGAKFDGVLRPWGHVVNNQQRIKPYTALPDNVKEFFDYGSNFTNTLSLSGSGEKGNYYTSYSNTRQKGITPGTEYHRNSLAFKGSTKLANNFSSTISLSYVKSGGDFALTGQGNSVYDQIIQTPRDIPILELKDLTNPFNDETNFYSPYTVNPYWVIANRTYTNNVDRMFGNATLGYKFNDNLNLTYRIGTDFYTDRRQQFWAIRDVEGPNAQNNDNGMYSETQIYNREINSDLMLSYFRNLTTDLTMDILVGSNVRQVSNERLFAQADALANNQFRSLSNIVGTPLAYSYRDKIRLLGVYGTAKFGFRDYAWLELTGRNDWASTLPINNNSFFYPAVSLAFDAATAFDFASTTPINVAKLRANYASVGNGGELPYQTRSVFVSSNISDGFQGTDLNFPFGGIPGFEVSNVVGNPTLKPEKTTSFEIGADLRFFDQRFTIDASYYDQRSQNLIVSVPIAYSTGFGSSVLNAGDMTNKGIELVVGGTPVQVENGFSWDVSVNFTKNNNLVTRTYNNSPIDLGGLSSAALIIKEGEPYGVFQADDVMRDPQGRIVVNPATGRPRVAAEQSLIPTVTPDWQGGVVNTFRYKGARLSVVVDTRQGGKMYSRTRATQRFAGTAPETLTNDRQPFIIPNSVVQVGNTNEYIENTTPLTNDNLYDYWGNLPEATNIIDASFTKLREVSFSYRLPTAVTQKTFFGNIELGLSGRNLFLWTPDENTYIDPEMNSFGNGNVQGFDYSGAPSTRTWGANIRLTF
ncbi:MAG: SusC/RagA family TonB-linked outer membrane protein [Adhaeribacter sp.]